MKLPASLVYRGPNGTITPIPHRVDTEVHFIADRTTEAVMIYFKTDGNERRSKIAIIVQKEDLAQFLTDIAANMPRLADVFAECAAVATKGYMELAKDHVPTLRPKKAGWVVRLIKRVFRYDA